MLPEQFSSPQGQADEAFAGFSYSQAQRHHK
jgi:hypothetical protein